MARDFYQELGVSKDSDATAIKKAYRKLASELHPDKNPGNAAAEQRFKAVNRAYDVLGDAKKRALYDEFGEDGLREGFDPAQARAYKQWGGARAGGGFPGGVQVEDIFGGSVQGGGIGDLFGDLFGRHSRASRRTTKGADLEAETTIDFVAAIRGTELQLSPRGKGEKAVTVRIPPGASEGSRVRVPGHGAASHTGGPPGDLVIVLHVRTHPHFRREDDDLHVDVPITVNEAYFGAKIRVPTPEGPVTLTVPEGTQSGHTLRLKGRGVARKSKKAGDLYVHVQVHVPEGRDEATKAAIESLKSLEPASLRDKLHF